MSFWQLYQRIEIFSVTAIKLMINDFRCWLRNVEGVHILWTTSVILWTQKLGVCCPWQRHQKCKWGYSYMIIKTKWSASEALRKLRGTLELHHASNPYASTYWTRSAFAWLSLWFWRTHKPLQTKFSLLEMQGKEQASGLKAPYEQRLYFLTIEASPQQLFGTEYMQEIFNACLLSWTE